MSPTSSRSSSMSSGSRASSKSPPDPAKKKFGCTFPACGKAFSRSEHLHRHALNHKEGNNTCLRCSAHFRRRDLLDRHMARHKEKDDEAGGEGLGVLATRKRLWRDENGSIVNSRRPTYTQEGAKRRQVNRPARKPSSGDEGNSTASSSCSSPHSLTPACLLTPISHQPSPTFSTIVVDSGLPDTNNNTTSHRGQSETQIPHDSWLAPVSIDSALPSPPFLSPTLHSADQSPSAELSEFDALYEDTTWPHINNTHGGLPSLSNSHPSTSTTSPILSTGDSSHHPWAPPQQQPFQTFMGAPMGEELPYDDIFKPEPDMYEWQTWNSHVLMSRCREEKGEEVTEHRRREWGAGGDGGGYLRQEDEIFRRPFVSGMGAC